MRCPKLVPHIKFLLTCVVNHREIRPWTSAAIVMAAGATATADTLYDQTGDDASYYRAASQDFEPAFDEYDSRAFDDFVVPAGESWHLSTLFINGRYSSSGDGPAPTVRVSFYSDANGSPGALQSTTDVSTFGDTAGDLTIPISLDLGTGHYWVSAQVVMNFDPDGQWGWEMRTVQCFNVGHWSNPGDGFGSGCTTPMPVTACGANAPFFDFVFRIEGEVACPADIAPAKTDGDGFVNVSDLLLVISEWGSAGSPADINGDNIVNVSDLLSVIAAWGPCPYPTGASDPCTGACCLEGAICQAMKIIDCLEECGEFLGYGTTCASTNCDSSNDDCVGAVEIAIGGSITDHLRDATQDDTAPSCPGDCEDPKNPGQPCSNSGVACTISPARGKWFKVVGDGTTLTASLCGSKLYDFTDWRLTVYCGPNCCNLYCVAARNTNCCLFLGEEASWCSAEGQTYYILVHTDSQTKGQNGDFTLTVTSDTSACENSAPCMEPNDECADAIEVFNGDHLATNSGTTTSGVPGLNCPADGTSTAEKDIWFFYTATCSGVLAVESCETLLYGSNVYDTMLAVYDGTCAEVAAETATEYCDDDSCEPFPSFERVELQAVQSRTYLIRVGTKAGTRSGLILLKVTCTP